jgi:hypothetical protein
LLGLLILATLWLRIANLGYSDFQGDEIKALCRLAPGQGLGDFLLGQRKGPLQFLVTCTTRLIDPDFSSELIVRLPFSIAGILAVYFFYKLVRLHFGEKPGIYAALLMAVNGLFVAFSRIAQYQSFTVLLTVLTLYCISLALIDEKWRFRGLYLGAMCAALCLLAHFDGGFVLPPAAYLIFLWLRKESAHIKSWKLWKHMIVAGGIFALLVGAFYLPYALKLSDYQLGYWEERISGASSDTLGLFKLYNPTIVIFIYLILIILSLVQFRRQEKFILLLIWFLPPLIFMEMVMTDPRTHFYTYLIPLAIFGGLGLSTFENLLKGWSNKFGASIGNGISLLLFVFLALLSHTLFIDHPPEYPWQTKSFLIWKLQPQAYEGMMGFPYSRHWREIGDFLHDLQGNNPSWYISNEKVAIAGFYLPETIQFYDTTSNNPPEILPGEKIFAIVVENPQSWLTEILGQSVDIWKSQHTSIKTIRGKEGELLAEIYAINRLELPVNP